MNRPGFPESSLVDFGHHDGSFLRLIVPLFTLRRRYVADRLEEPPPVRTQVLIRDIPG